MTLNATRAEAQRSGELGAALGLGLPAQASRRRSSSQRLLALLGSGRPQLPRPVGKRAAGGRQNTTVRVMSEEPTDAGFERFRKLPPFCFWFLFLPRPLFPPVADANSPVHNWGWEQRERTQPRSELRAGQAAGLCGDSCPGPGCGHRRSPRRPGGRRGRGAGIPGGGPSPSPPPACGLQSHLHTWEHEGGAEGSKDQVQAPGAGSRQEGLPHARWRARRSWVTEPGRGHSWAPARGTRPTPTTSVVPTRAGRPRGGTGPRGQSAS